MIKYMIELKLFLRILSLYVLAIFLLLSMVGVISGVVSAIESIRLKEFPSLVDCLCLLLLVVFLGVLLFWAWI